MYSQGDWTASLKVQGSCTCLQDDRRLHKDWLRSRWGGGGVLLYGTIGKNDGGKPCEDGMMSLTVTSSGYGFLAGKMITTDCSPQWDTGDITDDLPWSRWGGGCFYMGQLAKMMVGNHARMVWCHLQWHLVAMGFWRERWSRLIAVPSGTLGTSQMIDRDLEKKQRVYDRQVVINTMTSRKKTMTHALQYTYWYKTIRNFKVHSLAFMRLISVWKLALSVSE